MEAGTGQGMGHGHGASIFSEYARLLISSDVHQPEAICPFGFLWRLRYTGGMDEIIGLQTPSPPWRSGGGTESSSPPVTQWARPATSRSTPLLRSGLKLTSSHNKDTLMPFSLRKYQGF